METVARQFGCTAKKVRRMIHSGELEGMRLGREWRVDHASVDRLVQRYSLAGPPEEADPDPAAPVPGGGVHSS